MKVDHTKLRRIIEIALIILVSGVFFFACSKSGKENENVIEFSSENRESETTPEPLELTSAQETGTQTVCVYVCGAVNKPGVYELPANARKQDALNAAGGFTEDALKDAVNLAAFVEDADMLRIPYLGEEYSEEETGTGKETRININTAGINELTCLPGIGESKASAIVEYRNKTGKFSRVEDLMKVPGIKEGTFEAVRDLIRTE